MCDVCPGRTILPPRVYGPYNAPEVCVIFWHMPSPRVYGSDSVPAAFVTFVVCVIRMCDVCLHLVCVCASD